MSTNATTPTSPANTVFDTAYLAYVFNQRGYQVNEFATRLDLSNSVVEAILRGTVEPGELRIATLTNMANMLGIPLHTMFARPDPLPDPDTITDASKDQPIDSDPEQAVRDAEQLVACLYDIGRSTPTSVTELAKVFGWTLDRTYTAATEANRRLQPAGLKANTSHGELFIVPINEHITAQKALAARKVYERGLTFLHYKAMHQILTAQPITVNTSKRQRLRTLGGLVNLGILTNVHHPDTTDATKEAFI